MSNIVNKIYKISTIIKTISDEEMQEMKEIIDSQLNYVHPFKHKQAKKQGELGNHNQKVYDLISELRKCFKIEVQDDK